MNEHWLPDNSDKRGGTDADIARAEERARLLALCWDDRESHAANLDIITYWLEQSARERPPVARDRD